MSKRIVSGEGIAVATLPAWQATGLALAVVGSHVLNGSGVLVYGLLSAGVIWALHRLHADAPQSRSTADLIGSVLGSASARVLSVIQFVAYVLIGAYAAKSIGFLTLSLTPDPVAASTSWLWAATSVAAVGGAAVVAAALPTRVLAPVVTVLTGFGLLVFFYVALAVVAKVASGTAPIEIGTSTTSSEWGPVGIVIPLAIAVVGLEIPTAASDRLKSVGRPLGWAMAVVALCAVTAWVAANMGTSGSFRYDGGDLVWISGTMFGESNSLLLLAASAALTSAALLVLMWGAMRVAPAPVPHHTTGMLVVAVMMTLLTVAMCRGWGDASAKLWGVGAILLLVVYVLASRANSSLNDADTTAWALFALVCVVLAVAVFMQGALDGWWSVGIAAAIVGVAAALATKTYRVSRGNRKA